MTKEKVFPVPWGSESICYWCKKDTKCSFFLEDKEIRAKFTGGIPIMIRPTQLIKFGQLTACPIKEFKPNPSKLPKAFKGNKIVQKADLNE